MNKKIFKDKSGEKFNDGLFIILVSMSISLFAFVTEENKLTGFVALNNQEENDIDLFEFDNINFLGYLPAGNYYIDNDGIVYWLDYDSKPMAKVNSIDENQKDRHIYVDEQGRVGYVLEIIGQNE